MKKTDEGKLGIELVVHISGLLRTLAVLQFRPLYWSSSVVSIGYNPILRSWE